MNCPCKFGLHGPQLLRLDIYKNCITIPNHHQSNLVSSIYKSSNVSGWWFFATPLKKWWSKSVGMFWNSQHDGTVIKAMFQTTNQLNNGERSKLTLQKKRYKRLLRCFDGKSHVVKKGLTRVNFESCWDHELFGTWTCQPSWNFPGTGVARPDGVAVMNQRRDTRINQHPQSHSPKNVWQYYFGLVPPY
jgi:hypothetical protein